MKKIKVVYERDVDHRWLYYMKILKAETGKPKEIVSFYILYFVEYYEIPVIEYRTCFDKLNLTKEEILALSQDLARREKLPIPTTIFSLDHMERF